MKAEHEALSNAEDMVKLLTRLIGKTAADCLMDGRNLGGGRFVFPKSETGLGAQTYAYLVDLVGGEHTKRLCDHFNGDDVYIPKMSDQLRLKRNQEIVVEYNNGTSVRELMRKHNLSDRQIWTILKTTEMDSATDTNQESLF